MKCPTCGKEIPVSSLVCPFCYTTIEHNEEKEEVLTATSDLTTINNNFTSTSDNNELNFGDLNNTNYDDEHNTLKTYFNEPKKRRRLLIPIIGVFVAFALLFIILNMFKAPTIADYKYYTNVIDALYDYLDESFISSNAKHSGTYKLVYSINDESKEFKGNYQYDLSKKLIGITGDLKNPEEETGGIVVDDKTLTLELFLKNNELYFLSNNILENPILLPYEDETGLLTTKQYDLESLTEGIKNATCIALKNLTYTTEKKVTVDVKGTPKTVDKKVLVLNAANKKKFITVFFESLKDDSNFMNEYAKITGKKEADIEKLLTNYQTTYEYKYSTDDGNIAYINIYYKNAEVYIIEIDDRSNNNKLTVELDTNKYNITYYKDGVTDFTLNISRMDSKMNDVITRTYKINFKNIDYIININIELNIDPNPTVKSKDFENSKSIRDMNEDEINTIKTGFKTYMDNVDWIDTVRDIFKTKCNPELTCICNENEDVCTCTYNQGLITCPKEIVQPTVDEVTE